MRIFLKAPILCIGSIVLASMLNFKLSLIIYSIVAVVAILIIVSMKLSYPRFYKLQNAMDKVNSVVQEYLIGVRLVKAFGTYDKETDKFEDAEHAIDLDHPKGDVVFEDVCFSYNKANPVLKNINFNIMSGEVVALVGETGAGKTTIVNLLTRFYDADSGRILIDNEPIMNLKRDSLRKCFSVVLQDTCLFTGTIMDNIRYSQNDATDEQVIRASKIAHSHDFISKLPKGYFTMVSGATDNLSQGQCQLII